MDDTTTTYPPLPETTLAEMRRHCNNHFNAANSPDEAPDYPGAFVTLAVEIDAYRLEQQLLRPGDPARVPWTTAFAADMAQYKRAKFI